MDGLIFWGFGKKWKITPALFISLSLSSANQSPCIGLMVQLLYLNWFEERERERVVVTFFFSLYYLSRGIVPGRAREFVHFVRILIMAKVAPTTQTSQPLTVHGPQPTMGNHKSRVLKCFQSIEDLFIWRIHGIHVKVICKCFQNVSTNRISKSSSPIWICKCKEVRMDSKSPLPLK